MATFSDGSTKSTTSGTTRANALASAQHVMELADSQRLVADRLHERILQEIHDHAGAMPDAEQARMRQLMDDELLLRQRAQALYADAATFVIGGLELPQARLLALTNVAAEKIRRIGVIGEVTGLVGGILTLTGAIASGHLPPVVAAIEKIRLHNAALDALTPAPPAAS